MWWVSEVGQGYAHGFINSVTRKNPNSFVSSTNASPDTMADILYQGEYNALVGGAAYYVDKEMVELITAAARALPEDEVIFPRAELPHDLGVVYLEEAMPTLDIY